MRNEPNLRVEQYRNNNTPLGPSLAGANWGCFEIQKRGMWLHIISSGTDEMHGWEHVSVSARLRCPTWDEMNFVKELFWREDETVIQFHPKKSKYINQMPYCLHLWKKIGEDYLLPPDICV